MSSCVSRGRCDVDHGKDYKDISLDESDQQTEDLHSDREKKGSHRQQDGNHLFMAHHVARKAGRPGPGFWTVLHHITEMGKKEDRAKIFLEVFDDALFRDSVIGTAKKTTMARAAVVVRDEVGATYPGMRLLLATLLTTLVRRKTMPEVRTLLLLDECARLGALPHLKTALTLLRGYGVMVWSLWQDLSQMKTLYPTDWETILNNSSVVQVFGMSNG